MYLRVINNTCMLIFVSLRSYASTCQGGSVSMLVFRGWDNIIAIAINCNIPVLQ